MGYLLLTLFYILIDLVQIWNGAPFIYPGNTEQGLSQPISHNYNNGNDK